VDWLNINKLSLNLKKTHFIIFKKNRGRIKINNELVISNEVIKRSFDTKFLGVILDQHLTFEPHIRYIKGKISRGIGILLKGKRILNQSSLLTLYHAFLYPYFTFCVTVWGNTYPTHLATLVKCQKRAIRIICGARKYDHTSPLFENLKILNMQKLYEYHVVIFLYKYHHQKLPAIFDNFFSSGSSNHNYSTRQYDKFRPPFAKCFQRLSALRCSSANIHNKYVKQLNYDCSYPTFKFNARKMLLSQYA
jgi:hypothetical protein